MATIVLPQVLVFQEFQDVPIELTEPLRAMIFGPEYKLHRYAVSAERVQSGTYDKTLGNELLWLEDLERQAGSIVDLDYTKVYLEAANLKYWSNDAGAYEVSSSYTAPDATIVTTPVGARNKVIVGDVTLKTGNGYTLDSAFYSRPVQVGDYAKLSASIFGTTYNGEGKIIALEAEQEAAVIASASAATANKATQSLSAASATTVTGNMTLTAAGTYAGLADGVLTETYTIEVIKASTGGDATTAIFNITSASGKDDVLGFVPSSASLAATHALGTNGLTMAFAGDTNLDLGDKWTVEVAQAFTKPVATSSGTYTGTADTTYVIKVTRGGDKTEAASADKPLVTITTTTGVDSSSPQVVTASALAVGNFGVTVAFDQDELCAGDTYYVPVTAAGDGRINTLVLDNSLPTEMVSTASQDYDLTIELFIHKDMELPAELATEGVINWSQTATKVTLESGAKDFDSSWRDGDVSLPIEGGKVYVNWRELVSDHTDKIYTLTRASDINTLFTTQNDPDNPLVYAASKAVTNAVINEQTEQTAIRVMGVASNDSAGYQAVLDAAEVRDDVYSFVPLTFDPAIQTLVKNHVESLSTPETGLWRIALISSEEVNPAPIVNQNSDATPVLATIDSDKFLDLASASDVEFITAGVKPGDTVRVNYGTDQYGNATFEEYTIDLVLAEDRLKLTTAPDPAVALAAKIEVWRAMDATEIVDYIGDKANDFASRRVYNIYPSTIKSGGVFVAGYFLAASLAGIIGSVAPQQGLTNIEIKGFDNVDNVTETFNRTQLDNLANYGVWIVTEDPKTGAIYTRHQLSTDPSIINNRELNIVKNVDSVSYFFKNRLKSFIGRANVTTTALEVIRTQVDSGIAFLQASDFNDLIGGQVAQGTTIRELRKHSVLQDRIVITIDLVIPYPLNNIELNLVV